MSGAAGPDLSATAVIAAAGSGERLGAGGPKALVEVAGRPLLAWSLGAFAAAASVDRAIVAAPPGREGDVARAAEAAIAGDGLELAVVAGGTERSESVAAALGRVEGDLVAIHDAARPLVTPELIDAVLAKLASRPDAAGVIAAAPITDTVKRAREPRGRAGEAEREGPAVERTESRDYLWAAQTPQAFRAAALRGAHAADADRVAAATDDAMLVEATGGKVLIEPAPAANLKVTTAADLALATLMLTERRRGFVPS
ncbi:MAG TPA: 2-C-methyl-D-erythritol 4-phosphate cytidylyltransferase [Solirubrobacterales bacterium]|nr:2-C-methyl-D-erythritol 4-phosphate cytidylyltransferase [Solirubrobacterales bacterium]